MVVARYIATVLLLAFFGALVPMHQRGCVRIVADASGKPSVDARPPCHARKSNPAKPADPLPRSGNCAVCLLASQTCTPPSVTPRVDAPTLLGEIDPLPLAGLNSQHAIVAHDCRGPPRA